MVDSSMNRIPSDFIGKEYENIPDYCMIHPDDYTTNAFGLLYNKKLMIIKYLAFSNNPAEDIAKARNQTIDYLRAYAPQQMTFEYLSLLHHSFNSQSLGNPVIKNTYLFENLIVGAHYIKKPVVNNIVISYPFSWGVDGEDLYKSFGPTFDNIKSIQQEIEIPSKQLTIIVSDPISSSIGELTQMGSLGISQSRSRHYVIQTKSGLIIDKMMTHVWWFNNFMRMFFGRIVWPSDLSVTDTERINFKYYPKILFEFNKSLGNIQLSQSDISQHHVDLNNFKILLEKWFSVDDASRRSMSEYFESTRLIYFPRDKVVNLTAIFERIFTNTVLKNNDQKLDFDAKLRKYEGIHGSIKKLIRPYSKLSVNAIIKIRNHYTHDGSYSPGNESYNEYQILECADVMSVLIERLIIYGAFGQCKLSDDLSQIALRRHMKRIQQLSGLPD